MSAALDAAATVAIYLAWAIVILGGVVAIAAFASRWKIPKPPTRGAGSREERLPDPPATTGSPDWEWPVWRPYRGPGSWDPDAFRGSIAERASDEVWTRIGGENAVPVEPGEALTIVPARTAEALGISEDDGWTRIEVES